MPSARFALAWPVAVLIRRQRTGGKTTSDMFVANTYPVKQPGLKIRRPSLLAVTYRHGLVTVAADKEELAWGTWRTEASRWNPGACGAKSGSWSAVE